MTRDEFLAALSKRVDTKEQFDRLLKEYVAPDESYIGRAGENGPGGECRLSERHYYPSAYITNPVRMMVPSEAQYPYFYLPRLDSEHGFLTTRSLHHTRWWLARDYLRMHTGIYPMSHPLWKLTLSPLSAFAIHTTREGEDKTMIAYTPDATMGEADRKIRTTLSKALRKLLPNVADDALRDLEAAHRADMSDEIEFITGAAIAEAYQSGPGSCMSKYPVGYNLRTLHPALAYDAPGFALAVMRNRAGEINSRAITWTNPNDAIDKRFVRVFGDIALARRLQRTGFKCAGFAGARLRQVVCNNDFIRNSIEEYDPRVRLLAVPYADPPSDGSGRHASAFAALDGDEWLLMLDSEMQSRLTSAGAGRFISCNASVLSVNLDQYASIQKLAFTCPATGVTFNSVDLTPALAMLNGRLTRVHPDAVKGKPTFLTLCDEDTVISVAHLDENPATFGHQGGVWVDTEANRVSLRYRRLSKDYYPNEADEWHINSGFIGVGDCQLPQGLTFRGGSTMPAGFVRAADLCDVIFSGRACRLHRAVVEENHDQWVQVHSLNSGRPAHAHVSQDIVTTRSGRRCVPGVHEVVQLVDDTWMFRRAALSVDFGGHTMYMPKDNLVDVPTGPQQRDAFATYAKTWFADPQSDLRADELAAAITFTAIAAVSDMMVYVPCIEPDGSLGMVRLSDRYSNPSPTAVERYHAAVALAQEYAARDFAGVNGETVDRREVIRRLWMVHMVDTIRRSMLPVSTRATAPAVATPAADERFVLAA